MAPKQQTASEFEGVNCVGLRPWNLVVKHVAVSLPLIVSEQLTFRVSLLQDDVTVHV